MRRQRVGWVEGLALVTLACGADSFLAAPEGVV
jgi:hypothetical protein